MSPSHKKLINTAPPLLQPQQMLMAFDSKPLLGLTAAERMKALLHLANLLILATEEIDDER
jgi:hypothetical protein